MTGHVLDPAALEAPSRPAGYTPSWMTAAIFSAHPDAVVSGVTFDRTLAGTTNRSVARLTYSAGAGPETVVVKTQGAIYRRLVLSSLGVIEPEVHIYRMRDQLPLEIPLAYFATIDRPRRRSIVVMEDLNLRSATFNDATMKLDVETVAQGIDSLARMHGKFWGLSGPGMPDVSWAERAWRMRGWSLFVGLGIRSGIRKMSDALPNELRDRPKVTKAWRSYMEGVDRGVPTLLHGDAHVGNTYSLPDGTLAWLDWQVARGGSWHHDFGEFLVSALDIEDRRNHERNLLERYLDGVAQAGGAPPSFDEAWQLYRQSIVYGLSGWLTVAGLGGYQTPTLCRANIDRYATAFVDLDTGSLFG
ncbi:MAG TPA: phosphotransferase [Nocardioidaceae bacterium]|nr:phosphotransferase [Nocardioidaceae bacterium]